MKKLLGLAAAILIAAASTRDASATCAGGFTIYLSGQLPDVTLTSGVPETIHFNPWYVSFNSTSGSCGIFARSTVPGVSIQQTYGCPGSGCPILPPGQWAAVGDAYQTPITDVAHKGTDIPIVFNGSAPAGWVGMIEIGVNDNDHGDFTNIAIMGRMNVFVVGPGFTPPTWFTVSSHAGNVSGNALILDNPWLNSNPSARLFVSHIRNPGGMLFGTSWDHPIGITYHSSSQRWRIINTDGTTMPTGLGFGVRYDPVAPQVCNGSLPVAMLPIDNLLSNSNIWATIFVTQVGGTGHPMAVRYVNPRWQIVYSDGANIPANQCFHVKVFPFTQYISDPASGDLSSRNNVGVNYGVGEDISGFGSGHQSGSARTLQFSWVLYNSFRPMLWTFNQTPMGQTQVVSPKHFGFSVPQPEIAFGRWAIVREDGTAMGLNDRFNVWAPCEEGGVWFPDMDGDGYGATGGKVLSCNKPAAGYSSTPGDCNDSDEDTHPNAIEVNDGDDNQCPGDLGYGVADEISGFLVFDANDKTRLCWPPQQGGQLYAVAKSTTRIFSSCTILGTTSSTCMTDAAIPERRQAYYYLVRANNHHTGSWGQRSDGTERILPCP